MCYVSAILDWALARLRVLGEMIDKCVFNLISVISELQWPIVAVLTQVLLSLDKEIN